MSTLRIALVLLACSTMTQAGDWPQFRGPHFNGSSDETGLPTEWSDTENVAWTADLPGPSAATPIIVGDKVFISAGDAETQELKAIGIDRKSGKVLWTKVVGKGLRRDRRSTFAAPSPAADAERVVFFYGSGELVCFDHDGKQQWERNLQKDYGDFAMMWTFATSPLLYDGKLFMQVLQRDSHYDKKKRTGSKVESFLLALDPKTGKELWRHVRPSKARGESLEAFTTPTPYVEGGKKQLLIIGGDALSSHDAETGKELWRWGTWNPSRISHWRHVPSPIVGEKTVLVCAPKGDPVYAIKTGGQGNKADSDVAWITEKKSRVTSDVPTPAFADGDFFVLSDVKKSLTRVDPKTGKQKWQIKTPGLSKYEASPLVADGKVYLVNFKGEAVVVSASDGKTLATNKMNATAENPIRSTIAAAGGQLFLRTNRKLFCIGAAK